MNYPSSEHLNHHLRDLEYDGDPEDVFFDVINMNDLSIEDKQFRLNTLYENLKLLAPKAKP